MRYTKSYYYYFIEYGQDKQLFTWPNIDYRAFVIIGY